MSPLIADLLAYAVAFGGFFLLILGLVVSICLAARRGDEQLERECRERRHGRAER